MQSTGKPTGPLGLALLAATALTGVVLALHGWSGRNSGLAAGGLAAGSPPKATAGPSRQARPASPAPRASGGSPAATPGPLLSAQSYAPYSYRVWPGPVGTAAQAALTGLSVMVHRQGSGIMVTAGVNGQPGAAPRFYSGGARVYVVEGSLGDDSGGSDYNLGDDALVVTDARGRIVP